MDTFTLTRWSIRLSKRNNCPTYQNSSYKETLNSRPREKLQGIKNVDNEEVLVKLPDKNVMKQMINLQQYSMKSTILQKLQL